MQKGMKEMAAMTLAIERIIKTFPKTPSKKEAIKALRSCGIFDDKDNVNPAYKTILIKNDSKKMIVNNFDAKIYQKLPQIVLGFHGCDKDVAMEILSSNDKHLVSIDNDYDWLGDGIYFWLNDPQRAYGWACQTQKKKARQN